jgi:hypothetical protein
MWRRIFAILLLPSLVEASLAAATDGPQVQPWLPFQRAVSDRPESFTPFKQPQSARQTPPQATRAQVTAPLVSSYGRYAQLRRGTEEEVVVLVCNPANQARACSLREGQFGLIPVAVELTQAEGFAVRYRQGDEFRSVQQGAPEQAWNGDKVFRLKIRAAKDVPLGTHHLAGKLTFQAFNGSEVSQPQEMEVDIPLTVVEHDARVSKYRSPLDKHKPFDLGHTILVVVTAPLWLPFFLLFAVTCGIEGGEC